MGLPGLTRAEKKEFFILALVNFRGNLTKACEFAGISRQTYYTWMDRDESFGERVRACADDIRQTIADALEDIVVDSGMRGETVDAKWWLTKKARDRGFGDKVEIGGQLDMSHFKGMKFPDEPQTVDEFEKLAAEEMKTAVSSSA